jgi:hypothetical protein
VPCPEAHDALERAARRTKARMGGPGQLQDTGTQHSRSEQGPGRDDSG